ncbi:MAG: phosphotransferase [Prevotella sp.]|nr:phosphotransferase [Prevotella sp.]MCM1075258.1 phosphotransferase [Ruminococcus sp.]
MEQLNQLYRIHFGKPAETVSPILGSGSDRSYFRLGSTAGSAIGVAGTDCKENDTFIYIDKQLRKAGFNAPEIYGVSADGLTYLQQDLGDTSLFPCLHTPPGDTYVGEVMRTLPKMQFGLQLDVEKLYPVKEMTTEVAVWDLHYFKYCFLKAAGVNMDEHNLERDFHNLIKDLWSTGLQGWVYRDCQSRNIMIHNDSLWWIDFQSMRRGPALYDVASFLWQARAAFSAEERKHFADIYYNNLPDSIRPSHNEFERNLHRMAVLRTLQVLGAYGLRGLTEHKAHFVVSIPGALKNAVELMQRDLADSYPELNRVINEAANQERFRPKQTDGKLHVQIFSFSYKKGYPEDLSGNGGGFMFDCRAMHNPGRYDEYKPLTGIDAPVIEFLEQRREVQKFLAAAQAITDPAIERYISRGFSSLQIGFGCTGGRHRSVYCAQHLAVHVVEKFGNEVKVTLCHREQNIIEEL